MASGYLQGGDAYQLMDSDNWAGQTFRVDSPFTLQWVDLNLKLTNRSVEPHIYIFPADVDHLPSGDSISHSRYWLINNPLPPRNWLWHEPWGKTLTQNHPWEEKGFLRGDKTTLKNSQITIYNDATIGCNITCDLPPTLCPLIDADGNHLYLHHHSPYAIGSPAEAWFSYYLETFKDADQYLIEPLIARGTMWGAWDTYKSATATTFAFDHGKGPTILDITAAWIEGRTLAGLSNDPTYWYLKIIRIANEQFSTFFTQIVQNNFLGIANQQFTPVPDNDYDTLPPIYTSPNRLYRVRFSMKPVLLSPDNYYFMRVCSFPGLIESPQYWQYDKSDSTYPEGIRLSSDNGGDTWTKHFDDDHLFSAFGTPPAPTPPPPPPIANWVILFVEQFITFTGYKIACWTNVPCHLSLFWTNSPPDKHMRTKIVRGITVLDTPAYCFVHWEQVEQQESGDTVWHTFIIEPWPFCETRWYTFRALVNDEWSPSTAPIFKKHRGGLLTWTLRPIAPGYLEEILLEYPEHAAHWSIMRAGCESYIYGRWGYCHNYGCRDLYKIDALPFGIPLKVTIKGISSCTWINFHQRYCLYMPGYSVWDSTPWTVAFDFCYPTPDVVLTSNPITGQPWTYEDFAELQLGVYLAGRWSFGEYRWHSVWLEVEGDF